MISDETIFRIVCIASVIFMILISGMVGFFYLDRIRQDDFNKDMWMDANINSSCANRGMIYDGSIQTPSDNFAICHIISPSKVEIFKYNRT